MHITAIILDNTMIQLLTVLMLLQIGTSVSAPTRPIYLQPGDEKAIRSTVSANSHACTISTTEDCSITNMPRDESTQVYPGSKTRCIMSDSTDYSFQVVPGDKEKLLFYFQGGGACWNKQSTTPVAFCSVDAIPADLIGVFNRTDPRNRYKDYTIVHVLYCSGDVHGGNVTREYNDRRGEPVQQLGYFNTRAVVDWTLQQQRASSGSGSGNGIASVLTDLAVMGCSAGAMGLQLWIDALLEEISFEQAGVVPDSYLGVFPDGVDSELLYDYGYCGTPLVDPSLYRACMAQELTFQDVMMTSFPKHLDVPFGYIQSKVDSIQLLFYNLLGATSDQNATRSEFYYSANMILEEYNVNENVVVYLVDGPTHCFTNHDRYYTADTCGSNEDANNTDVTCEADQATSVQWLWNWTSTLPFPPPVEGNVVTLASTCTGELVVPESSISSLTYCDTLILPKIVSNTDPYEPSSTGDDDDGEDLNETVAIVVSVCVVVFFVAVVGYCLYSRKTLTAAVSRSDEETILSSGAGGGSMRTSLLTPAERNIAAGDDEDRDLMLLRDDSGITSVEL